MDLQQRSMITSEEIYLDLCNKIEHLEYMPGELISENELCAQYSTSRHMVRGAFVMLRQRKLIEVYPQRGSYVSLIDMDFINDILFLREAIEQESMQRLLEDGTKVEQTCKKMRAIIELQRASLDGTNPTDEYFRLDGEFHGCLMEAAGKKDIMHMLDDDMIHFRRWRNLELKSLLRVQELLKQHEEIVSCLEKRDSAATRTILHKHIDSVDLYNRVCETISNEYFYKKS